MGKHDVVPKKQKAKGGDSVKFVLGDGHPSFYDKLREYHAEVESVTEDGDVAMLLVRTDGAHGIRISKVKNRNDQTLLNTEHHWYRG